MKKAIGIALLWAFGSYMIGLPLFLSIIGAIGIVAVCFFGLYHRLVGTISVLVFLWGLAVALFGVPNFPEISTKNFGNIANVETPFKKTQSIDETLAKLEALRDAGTITDAQYEEAKAKAIDNFVTPE